MDEPFGGANEACRMHGDNYTRNIQRHGLLPEKTAAGLMLCNNFDTLLFKSPTCTTEDVKAAHELAEIGVDLKEYDGNVEGRNELG